jgi:hypothetical protein
MQGKASDTPQCACVRHSEGLLLQLLSDPVRHFSSQAKKAETFF